MAEVHGYDLDGAVAYHTGRFPPKNVNYELIAPSLTRATSALARYDAKLEALHNKELLLAPLRDAEAVVSSRIEGTIATLGPVDKGDSQEDQYVIQGGFWGGYRDPRFDERRGMGLP